MNAAAGEDRTARLHGDAAFVDERRDRRVHVTASADIAGKHLQIGERAVVGALHAEDAVADRTVAAKFSTRSVERDVAQTQVRERAAHVGRHRAERIFVEPPVVHLDVARNGKIARRTARDDRRIEHAADRGEERNLDAGQRRDVRRNREPVVLRDGPARARRRRTIEPQRARERRPVVARKRERTESPTPR